jgi:hypothetical protein
MSANSGEAAVAEGPRAAAPPPAPPGSRGGRDCKDHGSHRDVVDEPRLAEAGGEEKAQRAVRERLGARERLRIARLGN